MGVMRRNSSGYSSIGVVLSGSGKDHDHISYCQDCLNVKVLSPLRNRIYLDEDGNITNPGPDAKNWLQCWTCGVVVGAYEAKQEADIVTLTEPGDNPFKFGNGKIRSVGDTRKFDRTGKTQHKKQFKQDLSQYKEEEVKEALRKGAKLVSYVET